MTTRLVTIALSLFVLASAGYAQEKSDETPLSPEAKKHFDLAVEHYQAERYSDAAAELAKAHEIEPRVDIKFAWAQAERLAGNCAKAIDLYHQLRKQTLPEADRIAVLDGLDRCNAFDQEAEPEPEPEPEPSPTPPDPTPRPAAQPLTEPAAEAERSPWYSDWIGNALVVSGAVGLGVGTSFWFISSSQADDSEAALTYDEHVDLENKAKRNRTISIVSSVAGIALVGGGIARYLTRDSGAESDSVAASGWISGSSAGLAIGGRF